MVTYPSQKHNFPNSYLVQLFNFLRKGCVLFHGYTDQAPKKYDRGQLKLYGYTKTYIVYYGGGEVFQVGRVHKMPVQPVGWSVAWRLAPFFGPHFVTEYFLQFRVYPLQKI